jgi:hypothetical protein
MFYKQRGVPTIYEWAIIEYETARRPHYLLMHHSSINDFVEPSPM